MQSGDHADAINLRPAALTDVEAMAAIEMESFSDPWPASGFHELMAHSHVELMVAVDASDRVCGYCVLLHVLDEGEIANIAVTSDRRRQGIAARLLDDALDAAHGMGIASVYLEVRMSNAPARSLYASRGFEPVGRRRAYYREPVEDALILRREAPSAR